MVLSELVPFTLAWDGCEIQQNRYDECVRNLSEYHISERLSHISYRHQQSLCSAKMIDSWPWQTARQYVFDTEVSCE